LTADGAISLLDRRLDMELAVGDVATEKAEGADVPATVGALKMHKREIINVHGPWSAPAIRSGQALDDPLKFGPPSPG
jgi:hypothetical protein